MATATSTSRWLWLCAALLLANVLYYLWPLQPGTPAQPAEKAGSNGLLLLSEVHPADLASIAVAPVTGQPERVVGDEHEPVAPGAISELASGWIEADTLVSRPAPESPLQPLPPIKSVRLELPSQPENCWLFRPLQEAGVRDAVQAEMSAAGLPYRSVVRGEVVGVEYWVHLSRSGDADEMTRLRREIQNKGIDTYEITEGELAGSLSLGLFREQALAVELLQEREQQGYTAQIAELDRVVRQQWLLLSQDAYQALGWPAEGGPGGDWTGSTFQVTQCPAESIE